MAWPCRIFLICWWVALLGIIIYVLGGLGIEICCWNGQTFLPTPPLMLSWKPLFLLRFWLAIESTALWVAGERKKMMLKPRLLYSNFCQVISARISVVIKITWKTLTLNHNQPLLEYWLFVPTLTDPSKEDMPSSSSSLGFCCRIRFNQRQLSKPARVAKLIYDFARFDLTHLGRIFGPG